MDPMMQDLMGQQAYPAKPEAPEVEDSVEIPTATFMQLLQMIMASQRQMPPQGMPPGPPQGQRPPVDPRIAQALMQGG